MTITQLPVSTSVNPTRIAAGPDGNVWFIDGSPQPDRTQATIGRFDRTGGSLQTFLIASRKGGAFSVGALTGSADGNVYVTYAEQPSSTNGFKSEAGVAQVAPGGTYSLIAVPNCINAGDDIAVGPDGNLWFVDSFNSTIFTISPSGTNSASFAVSGASGSSRAIASGPDGKIWFGLGANLVQMGTDGSYQLHALSSTPGGLTAGPDGNMWFTERSTNTIGRMTPSGVLSEYAVPTPNAQLSGVAVGGDSNLWFLEVASQQLGHLIISTATAVAPQVAIAATGAATIEETGIPATSISPNDLLRLPGTNSIALILGGDSTANGQATSRPGNPTYSIDSSCPTIDIAATRMNLTVGQQATIDLIASGGTAPYQFTFGPLPPGLTANGSQITGTPTAAGSPEVAVSVRDSVNCATTLFLKLNITCPTINIAPNGPLLAVVGAPINLSFLASGGTAPYTFDASLPAGLSILPNGSISGTPANPGASSVFVTVKDRYGCLASASFLLDIIGLTGCPTINVAVQPPAQTVKAGATASITFTASGGAAPYEFSLDAPLPQEFHSTLVGVNQLRITGAPTAGTVVVRVHVTDANNCPASAVATINVQSCPKGSITYTGLPFYDLNSDVSIDLTVDPPDIYEIKADPLPPGLELHGQQISGAPTVPGLYFTTLTATGASRPGCPIIRLIPFVISGYDVGGCNELRLSIPDYTNFSPKTDNVLHLDNYVSGGTRPFKYTLEEHPPEGISIDGSDLHVNVPNVGPVSFLVTVIDFNGCKWTQSVEFMINPTLTLAKFHTSQVPGFVDYFFVVTNSGASDYFGLIKLTDSMPAGVAPVEFDNVHCQYDDGQRVFSCTSDVLGLKPGEQHRFEMRAGFDPNATAPFVNTASIITQPDQKNSVPAMRPDILVPDGARLEVTKSHSGMTRSSKPFVWTINIRNTGGKDTEGPVYVEDTLPDGVQVDKEGLDKNFGVDCKVIGQLVRCQLLDAVLPLKAPPAKERDSTRTIRIPVTGVPKLAAFTNSVVAYGGSASRGTATDTVQENEK